MGGNMTLQLSLFENIKTAIQSDIDHGYLDAQLDVLDAQTVRIVEANGVEHSLTLVDGICRLDGCVVSDESEVRDAINYAFYME